MAATTIGHDVSVLVQVFQSNKKHFFPEIVGVNSKLADAFFNTKRRLNAKPKNQPGQKK